MSAPDTNTEKQAKRHKPPLIGMPAAIILATVLFIGVMIYISVGTDEEIEEPPVPVTNSGN